MIYPIEILPQLGYKKIVTNPSHYLIRYTEDSDYWDATLNQIKDKAICSPSTNMMDLSTSVFGVFTADYSKIKVTNESYNEYCAPNITIPVPKHPDDFEMINTRDYWFILISKIQNLEVTYKFGEETFKAVCHVIHTPMKWNYWHFSIRWFLINEQKFWHELDDADKKKAWAKDRLSSNTRTELKMMIDNIKIDGFIMDEALYKSN